MIVISEMVKIVHNDYEKISDTVFWIDRNWVLKFVVRLNKYTEKGKDNFHKEFGYNTKNGFGVSINRSFDYFLQLESTARDSNGFKDTITITQNDIYFFQFKLAKAVEWFTGNQTIFARKGGEIFIPSKTYSERVDLTFGDYIEMEPSVIKYDNGNQIIGVRFYLGNDVVNFFMDVNKFLSFNYFISTFNMYLAAQGLLAYLGRPEYGTNYNSFASSYTGNKNSSGGFFNKVNAVKV